jgi:hypothetical protein
VAPILSAHGCTGCHGGTEGLTITYTNLIDGMTVAAEGCNPARHYVVSGSPSTSYLYEKVTGTNLCGGTQRMPPGGPFLSSPEIQTIASWICDGAKQ